jgi:hypothetical protein
MCDRSALAAEAAEDARALVRKIDEAAKRAAAVGELLLEARPQLTAREFRD